MQKQSYNFFMSIKIGSIGYNHFHNKNFKMDLPQGPGAYLFLIVKSSAIFFINHKKFNVLKNSYVILKPSTPCFYTASRDIYADDWFYFSVENQDDENELILNGLVFDAPVFLGSTDELSSIIHHISYEHFSSEIYHNEIKELFTKIFFLKISRMIKSKKIVSPNVLSSKNDKISYLKTRLFDEPNLFSNIDEMANFVGLSRSGLQHLYKKTFGVSVISDVINGRIEKAKSLLARTNFTVSEIAQKCGYKNDFHFMRQFKNQTGLTPTQYRNGSSWLQIEKSRN